MIAMPFLSLIFTLDKEKGKEKIMTKGGGGKEGAKKETQNKKGQKKEGIKSKKEKRIIKQG